ncbi:MAG: tetratricopeptide repeat protein [Candidatus Thermoplasmatota archaeon]
MRGIAITTGLVGREKELARLNALLDEALGGKGSTALVSGEAGIGKTRLLDELLELASSRDVMVLSGRAAQDICEPFFVLSEAMKAVTEHPLFQEEEYRSFAKILAVDQAGLLLGLAPPEHEDEMDADILAGMLSAVQNFIRDSFDRAGEGTKGLGRLEYGDMKILVEHGEGVFLTAVFSGSEHPDMRPLLTRTVRRIEESGILGTWSGKMDDVQGVQEEIDRLSKARFLVRRDLEGIRLEEERLRIGNATLTALINASERRAVLLALEDLHWADESSLFVLQYLARNIAQHRILILGTFRPGEDGVENRVAKMRAEGTISEIALAGLGNDKIIELVDSVYAPHKFPEGFLGSLAERCEGNPFFVGEVLRHMLSVGSMRQENGTYIIADEGVALPHTVEEAVNRRLETLDPDAMTLAEYASCIGREFPRAAVLSIELLNDPKGALQKLNDAGIVHLTNGSLDFSHALFQEVIYSSMNERWRAIFHQKIGEYYEVACEGHIDEVLYDLARHFSRSRQHEKGFGYCVRAGEKAESAYAAEQAIEYYERALSVAQKIKLDPRSEVRLLHGIATNAQLLGRWSEAEERLRNAFDLSLKAGEKALAAESRSLLGDILRSRGKYDEALSVLNEAHAYFTEVGDARGAAKALNCMGLAYWDLGENAKTMECYEEALKAADVLGDRKLICRALNNKGLVLWSKGEYAEAMECYMRSLRLSEEMGDKLTKSVTIANIGITHYAMGDYAKALACHHERMKIAEELADMRGIGSAVGNMGNIHFALGDYAKALECYKRSLKIMEAMGDKRGIGITCGNIGNLHREMGDYSNAEACYDRAIEIARAAQMKFYLSGYLHYKAELYFRQGKAVEANLINEEALALAEEVKRTEIVSNCTILRAKIIALENKTNAIALLKRHLSASKDELALAAAHYELYKLSGDETHRSEAIVRYKRLFERTPNVKFRQVIKELERG